MPILYSASVEPAACKGTVGAGTLLPREHDRGSESTLRFSRGATGSQARGGFLLPHRQSLTWRYCCVCANCAPVQRTGTNGACVLVACCSIVVVVRSCMGFIIHSQDHFRVFIVLNGFPFVSCGFHLYYSCFRLCSACSLWYPSVSVFSSSVLVCSCFRGCKVRRGVFDSSANG